jgi:SWI/SNF-related matrix-associated actin-dependent regulator 1 of chromatin subfamily A
LIIITCLIDINNIPEQKALKILDEYRGVNNFILKLKEKYLKNKKFYPTRTQADYIITYETIVPKVAKKWVDLDIYFAKKFANDKAYIQIPEKIYVEKLLVEKDTSYHIWGKFFENEELTDIWLPKVAILKTSNVKVEVDYEKYAHRPPLEHQKIAIETLLKNDKFILADSMGVGKTTSAIIASLESKAKKILIICPASLKINWKREIELYTNDKVAIIDGKIWIEDDVTYTIINYDILKNFYDSDNPENSELIISNFDLCIIDEAHKIANSQTIRTKIILAISGKIKKIWLLSGTPITSRPINYFNLLKLIDCPVANNWMAYVKRYCNGFQFKAGKRKIWNVSGASNLDELRERTSKYILRRHKEDILDLPEKIITPIYLRLKSKEYENFMGEYYDWYDNKKEESSSLTVQFTKLMKVRKLISLEKIQSTIDFCEDILEQGKKIIIFTNFIEPLNKIYEHFGDKAVKLDGSMNSKQKQESVDKFQNDEKTMIFVGQIIAAGVGLTLTSAEVVVMNDLSFVPADHAQAEDRAYRFGQKNKVLVYYPIFENTIEGKIYDILNRKKQIVRTVMGDGMNEVDSVEEILSFINNSR